MSFTYTTTVPTTGHQPKNDYQQMQVNYASIASLVAVDHVGFNNAQAGLHNQVTFAAPITPAVFTYPIIYAATDPRGNGQVQFSTTTAAASQNQYVNALNGSTLLPGGIIMKYGQITLTATPQTITYTALSPPITAFPNQTYTIHLYAINSTAATKQPYISGVNATSFTVTNGFNTNPASYYFIAIGV